MFSEYMPCVVAQQIVHGSGPHLERVWAEALAMVLCTDLGLAASGCMRERCPSCTAYSARRLACLRQLFRCRTRAMDDWLGRCRPWKRLSIPETTMESWERPRVVVGRKPTGGSRLNALDTRATVGCYEHRSQKSAGGYR